jgi:ferritin
MQSDFLGVVKEVMPKLNKVMVLWGGGSLKQHDPDEIMLHPHQDSIVKSRMASSRRSKKADFLGVPVQNPPSSRVQTDFLSPEMEDLLNRQVGVEMYSAYIYFMYAAWFQSKGLVGFQAWMERQGDDEIEHAMKVYNYLVDTGSDVQLPAIDAPAMNPSASVLEVTRAVLDHEMTVTQDWKRIGQLAKAEDNPATFQMVQEFISEQIEEEDGAVTLHQKVQLADSGSGLLMVDHELKCIDPNAKTASMKTRRGADNPVPHGDQYVGDPEMHGINEARGGGFSIMQDLQKDLHKEMKKESDVEVNPRVGSRRGKASFFVDEGEKASDSSLKSRRAMYWGAPERIYRLTKEEQENGSALCPKCHKEMGLEPFTKSEKLYTC